MKKILKSLPFLIFSALLLGVIFGKIISSNPTAGAPFLELASWIGEAFLRLLKMVIAPLIFSSIVSGVSNIGSAGNIGRIGGKTISLFLLTSLIAIVVGLGLVNLIKPGVGAALPFTSSQISLENLVESQQTISQIIMDIIPSNVVKSFADGNMLQIIVFAMLFGFFTTKIDERLRQNILTFFNGMFAIMMRITIAIISLAPLGILGIVTEQIASHSNILELFSSMGLFIITVLLAIAVQFFIILPLLMKLLGGLQSYKYMSMMSLPLITAFTTASSTATLPLSMEAAEKKAGISNSIVSFCLPLGATINMNGTALFECVSVIFLAQAYGIDLSITQQLIIVGTSLLAAIGSAGIPMAGLVMMTIILTAVGLPLEGIGLIMSVNFILDMARTSANVWGDCAVAAIVAKSEGEKLNI